MSGASRAARNPRTLAYGSRKGPGYAGTAEKKVRRIGSAARQFGEEVGKHKKHADVDGNPQQKALPKINYRLRKNLGSLVVHFHP